VSSARTDLCGGRSAMIVPTATPRPLASPSPPRPPRVPLAVPLATRTTGQPELMYFRGWPQANMDARINYWLGISKADGGMYGLTPDNRTKPFVPGSRFRR
jgi:hypothetical protein